MDDDRRAHRVLIATTDARVAKDLEATLDQVGVGHRAVSSSALVGPEIESGGFDVAVVDLAISPRGVDLVGDLLARSPDLSIIALTSGQDTHLGVQAVRLGAADFVRTPVDGDEIRYVLAKSLRLVDFSDGEPARSVRTVPRTSMVGTSAVMRDLGKTIAQVANGIATVLVGS